MEYLWLNITPLKLQQFPLYWAGMISDDFCIIIQESCAPHEMEYKKITHKMPHS